MDAAALLTDLRIRNFGFSVCRTPEQLRQVVDTLAYVAGSSAAGLPENLQDILWKFFFFGLDTTKRIEISGTSESSGRLTLTLALERPDTIEVPLGASDPVSSVSAAGERVLSLEYTGESGRPVKNSIRESAKKIRIDQSKAEIPFPAVFLSSRSGNPEEDASSLGQLRIRKQGGLIADALRIIEPKLKSVEDSSAGGRPMIWGDIGLPEMVPLPAMGEGMTRIARLILAISRAPGGVILIDEIENGLSHSILTKVWRAIEQAARRFDAQIIATTHSFECVEAACCTVDASEFRLHRLEAGDEGNRCVTYEPEALEAAVRHRLEVR